MPDTVSTWPLQRIVHVESNLCTCNETLFLISFLAEPAAIKESCWVQVQKCFTHEIYWLSGWFCPITVSTGRVLLCLSHAASVAVPHEVVLCQCVAKDTTDLWVSSLGFIFGACVKERRMHGIYTYIYIHFKEKLGGFWFLAFVGLIAIIESIPSELLFWNGRRPGDQHRVHFS